MADINMTNIEIGWIPAILWGKPSEKVYFYVHGKAGCKEEAEILAQIVCMQGWQVISFDLTGHGQRKSERNTFNPWDGCAGSQSSISICEGELAPDLPICKQFGGMVFHAGVVRREVGKMSICFSRFGYAEINRKYDGMDKCDIGTAGTGERDSY